MDCRAIIQYIKYWKSDNMSVKTEKSIYNSAEYVAFIYDSTIHWRLEKKKMNKLFEQNLHSVKYFYKTVGIYSKATYFFELNGVS